MWCYKIRWFDEYTRGMRVSEGLISAVTAQEAMDYLHTYYGVFDRVKLAAIEEGDSDCRILPFDEFDANWATFVKEENF